MTYTKEIKIDGSNFVATVEVTYHQETTSTDRGRQESQVLDSCEIVGLKNTRFDREISLLAAGQWKNLWDLACEYVIFWA